MYKIVKNIGWDSSIRFSVKKKNWLFWTTIATDFGSFDKATEFIKDVKDASDKVGNFNNQKRKS